MARFPDASICTEGDRYGNVRRHLLMRCELVQNASVQTNVEIPRPWFPWTNHPWIPLGASTNAASHSEIGRGGHCLCHPCPLWRKESDDRECERGGQPRWQLGDAGVDRPMGFEVRVAPTVEARD